MVDFSQPIDEKHEQGLAILKKYKVQTRVRWEDSGAVRIDNAVIDNEDAEALRALGWEVQRPRWDQQLWRYKRVKE